MNDSLKLYELAGANDDWRFSPYCWRIRLALAHKGLSADGIAWHFTEKEKIAFSGQGKVPVLVQGEQTIVDSWAIANHLEATYPDRPSLFLGPAGLALSRFLQQWTNEVLNPALAKVIVPDVFDIIREQDKAYFRETREKAFGCTLEALAEQRETHLEAFKALLKPLRSTLAAQPFLCGDAPAYGDHIVFSSFQWARVCSPVALLDATGPLEDWHARMLDAYDGEARSASLAY